MTKTARDILGGDVEANIKPVMSARTLASVQGEANIDADLRETREKDALCEPDARQPDNVKSDWDRPEYDRTVETPEVDVQASSSSGMYEEQLSSSSM